jgi:hypothetical protein
MHTFILSVSSLNWLQCKCFYCTCCEPDTVLCALDKIITAKLYSVYSMMGSIIRTLQVLTHLTPWGTCYYNFHFTEMYEEVQRDQGV